MLALVVVFTLPISAAQETDPETISVCDALRNPPLYDGKMVAIRGYLISTDEGGWLSDECKEHLTTTSGLEWPNTIWVGGPRSDAVHKLDFEPNERARQEVRAKIAKEIKGLDNYRIRITYVGLFETRRNLRSAVYTDKSGGLHLAGFGHLGSAPAQLFIKTAKDAVVEHLKAAADEEPRSRK
jgi:hypothetical protein